MFDAKSWAEPGAGVAGCVLVAVKIGRRVLAVFGVTGSGRWCTGSRRSGWWCAGSRRMGRECINRSRDAMVWADVNAADTNMLQV